MKMRCYVMLSSSAVHNLKEMTLRQFRSYCSQKKGVEETFPFGEQTAVYKLSGKMFTLTNVIPFMMGGEEAPAFHHVSVKSDPDIAADLRRNFEAIIPGWYLNKTHWISLIMDGSLKDGLVKELVDNAYELVFSKLPKKEQERLR